MRAIGIDLDLGLVYEGQSPYGRGVWPSPTLFLASVLSEPTTLDEVQESADLAHARLIFREDSFDAITRLRRGRFYAATSASQPHQWQVEPHPTAPMVLRAGPRHPALLHGFAACPAARPLDINRSSLVALGPRSACSLWRVVAVERIVTGEDLVTLRARSALGLLPELKRDAIPPDAVPKVVQVIDALVDAAHASGPASVVDRARDAGQWCLGVWLAAEENDPRIRLEDLGALAQKLDSNKKAVSAAAAKAIARLHSRGKPNEHERYSTRPLSEEDAEFALAAVGLLLREIGWAG
jgi:hypothetical protein